MSEHIRNQMRKKGFGSVPPKIAQKAPPTPPVQHTKVLKPIKPYVPPTPNQLDQRANVKGRLPDGSLFRIVYDAEQQKWRGSLAVGGIEEIFSAESSGAFKLLDRLDNLYRKHLEEMKKPKA